MFMFHCSFVFEIVRFSLFYRENGLVTWRVIMNKVYHPGKSRLFYELQTAAASSQPSTSYQSKPSLRIYGEAELAEQPLVLPGVGRDGSANQHLALLNGVQKDGSVILASGV